MPIITEYALRDYLQGEAEQVATLRGVSSDDDRRHFIEMIEGDRDWKGHNKHLALVKDDLLIGDIQLRRCHQTMPPGVPHIGIEIADSWRGKGAGTSALELTWEWAKSHNFHRLEGSTEVSNVAMKRAFEKAGWNFEGILKN